LIEIDYLIKKVATSEILGADPQYFSKFVIGFNNVPIFTYFDPGERIGSEYLLILFGQVQIILRDQILIQTVFLHFVK